MQKFEMRSGDVEIGSPTTLLQPRLAPNAECTEDIDTGDEISGRRIVQRRRRGVDICPE